MIITRHSAVYHLTCGPSLKPQTAHFSFIHLQPFHTNKPLRNVSEPTFLMAYTCDIGDLRVVLCCFGIFLPIVLQLHFAFLCTAMFVGKKNDGETSRPDLKLTALTVFMMNLCFSCQ